MNGDLSLDVDRQYVFTTATPLVNSKLDFRWPIPEIRQHDRKKILKKLKVIMIDKVIMTAEKENERLGPFIREKSHKRGDQNPFSKSLFLGLRTSSFLEFLDF